MTVVSGDIRLVTDKPDSVSQVWLRAPRGRVQGTAYVTESPDARPVENGAVSFTAFPGPLVMVLVAQGQPLNSVKLIVPDKASATLRECIEAAGLADDGTLNALERLAQEVAAAAVTVQGQVPGLVADAIASDQTVVDAAVSAVNSAAVIADVQYVKPPLSSSNNLDVLTNGLYPVRNGATATALGLPEGTIGHVQHVDLDPSRLYRRQYYRADPTQGAATDYRRTYYNGTWNAWALLNAPVDFPTPYLRGAIPDGMVLAEMTGPDFAGLWTYNSGQASAWGLPSGAAGVVEIVASGLSTLHNIETLTTPIRTYKRRWYNGAWSGDWEQQNTGGGGGGETSSFYRGAIPEGLTPEQMTGEEYQGLWTYSSSQAIAWSVPSRAAGFLQVSATRTSTLHEGTSLTTPIRNFQRRWYNGNWSGDWEIIGGITPAPTPEPVEADEYATATSKVTVNSLVPEYIDPTDTYEIDHANLVDNLKARLGTVSTGGKAAVALVADHGTTAFKDWLWQAAKERNIPFTMALAPEIHLDGKGDTRHAASNDDIKQWISEGLVIASHSGDHSGALGYFDISRQIKTSKAKLEEKLETTVDCWVQPGYTLATGNYDGFGTGQSASRYTDYYAGRMLQQTYAVVTGYAGNDFVYPGDDDLPVGVRRSLTERKDNQAGVIANIEQAIATGGKHINFCHPYALPDSSSTYVTKAEYIAYLDWLAQKRDAGDLVLLTLPQLAIARP